jgi:hypothetical protein
VQLVLEDYDVTIQGSSRMLSDIAMKFSDRFKALYEKHQGGIQRWTRREIYADFCSLMGKGVWDSATYIPSERPYFVDTNRGYRFLSSEPDPIAKRFAESYSNSLNIDIPKPRLSSFLRGELKRGGNSWMFAFDDRRTLPLSHLSSGSKQLFALFSVLETYEKRPSEVPELVQSEIMKGIHECIDNAKTFCFDEFFVEEPESDIFPETQYDLVRFLAQLTKGDLRKAVFTITTHSPYVLSSLNNLLEAWQAGHMDEQRAEAVRAVIDEKYWVNPEEFCAYAIEDGVLNSIVADDTRLIRDNYLDSVSETIGAQFDELLRIGYVEA